MNVSICKSCHQQIDAGDKHECPLAARNDDKFATLRLGVLGVEKSAQRRSRRYGKIYQ